MRDSALLGLRVTLGGYLAVHGAQKLFGALDGPGLDKTAANFHMIGLRPGRAMATLAGGAEFVGGALTVLGMADPVGPVAIAGAMVAASTVHGNKGPFQAKGGYELAATNLAAALTLAGTGPGRYSVDSLLGRRLPKSLIALIVLGGTALTAYSVSGIVRARGQAAIDSATPPPVAAADIATSAPAATVGSDSDTPVEDTAGERTSA
jgi:putative oxidoreductase